MLELNNNCNSANAFCRASFIGYSNIYRAHRTQRSNVYLHFADSHRDYDLLFLALLLIKNEILCNVRIIENDALIDIKYYNGL